MPTREEIASRQHHIFGGSSLARRYLCPGSARAERNAPPSQPSEWAQLGERLHREVAWQGTADDLSAEDQELAQKARDWRDGIYAGHWEYEVFLPLLDSGGKLISWGWADAVAVLPDRLLLGEFKFGWSKIDTLFASWQLAFYAVALWQIYQLPVEGHLFCARTGEEWSLNLQDGEKELAEILKLISRCDPEDAELNATPNGCRYCRALPTCKAALKEISVVVDDNLELTPERRALRREFLELVDNWASTVKQDDRQYLLSGGYIPGWKVLSRQGRRYIDDPQAAFDALGGLVAATDMLAVLKVDFAEFEAFVARVLQAKGLCKQQKEAEREFARLMGELIKRGKEIHAICRDRST